MEKENLYDVIVIGGGPAGLTAALYLARARYRVLVVEKEHFGGQITITSEVVNYPGIERTNGTELTNAMRKQAQNFGAEFLLAEAENLDFSGDIKMVDTNKGRLKCFGVLLATGAHPRMIGFKGEAEFRGHGVAYCATCDGEFFTGKEVFVVGGGFAAAEESVFLTQYASHVTILVREDDFTCAKATAEEARKNEKITVLTNTEVVEASGDDFLRTLKYKNNVTGEVTEYKAPKGDTFGIFVFAGYEPATELVRGLADINEQNYVKTDLCQKTSVDGLYAAGDVCVKNLRQVVTAVGDGALAATELERYAKSMQEKTGIKPVQPDSSSKEHKEEKATVQKNAKTEDENSLFSEDMLEQLNVVFDKMERSLLLKLYLKDDAVSKELKQYMETLADMTDKLILEIDNSHGEKQLPCVRVCLTDGTQTGLAFHGVPGGHEFTSFILGLYNAAGPGQIVETDVEERIKNISDNIHLQIMVSLSCTMCPDLVTSAQKIAAGNPNVIADVYDLNHFPDLKEKYQVMSVPCMVINGEKPVFGKKNIRQILDLIE
ncbi:MAG: FAD-dependent oxidoreductase [Lachnospiraceae bacterium]|nr:FAD-dependent oxidoreductase [Lachnospiraceae bacterium]